VKPQIVQFPTNGAGVRQVVRGVPFLLLKLPSHLLGGQPRIQPLCPKSRVGLALGSHQISNVFQQTGQSLFGSQSPATGKSIGAGNPTVQFAEPFSDGDSAPTQFGLGSSLSTWPERFNGLSHETPSFRSAKRLSRLDQRQSKRIRKFHLP
jgi:hypothetical protein